MDLVKWLLLFLYIFVIASAVRRRVQKLDEPINDEVLIARSFEEWSRLPRETLVLRCNQLHSAITGSRVALGRRLYDHYHPLAEINDQQQQLANHLNQQQQQQADEQQQQVQLAQLQAQQQEAQLVAHQQALQQQQAAQLQAQQQQFLQQQQPQQVPPVVNNPAIVPSAVDITAIIRDQVTSLLTSGGISLPLLQQAQALPRSVANTALPSPPLPVYGSVGAATNDPQLAINNNFSTPIIPQFLHTSPATSLPPVPKQVLDKIKQEI